MSPRLDDDEIRVRLVTLRLILGAMIAGVVILALAGTFLLRTRLEPQPELLLPLGGALVALGAAQAVAWPIVRKSIAQRLGSSPTADRALETFRTVRLIGAALAESFALFGVVVYLVTGSQLALLAPAIGIFLLLRLQPDPRAFRGFARDAGVVDPGP